MLISHPNLLYLGSKPQKKTIPGSESPEIHALCVWENVVVKAENATHIALLGYGNGASLCKDLLLRQMVRSKEDESEQNRIKAFITIEASHIVEEDDAVDIKDFMNRYAINLECNKNPRGYRLIYRKEKLGCTSISLGLPEGSKEVVNVAESVTLSLNPVFMYMKIALQGGHVAKSFFNAFAKESGHSNPQSAEVTTAPPSDDEMMGMISSPSKEQLATSAPKKEGGFFSRLFGGSRGQSMSKTAKNDTSDEEKITVNDFDLLKIVGKGAFGKVKTS